MMSFIKDDGKGFVGIHSALDTNHTWPEYGEMLGGWFDEHPWMTFEAPIVNEDPSFPAVRHFPAAFVKYDEIYQPKDWSRDKVNVLLSLDPSKLDYSNNPKIHRADHDFPVAWSKMYGKGRVFYSTLGHTEESWQDPDIRTMYFEAIKWALQDDRGKHGLSPASGRVGCIPLSQLSPPAILWPRAGRPASAPKGGLHSRRLYQPDQMAFGVSEAADDAAAGDMVWAVSGLSAFVLDEGQRIVLGDRRDLPVEDAFVELLQQLLVTAENLKVYDRVGYSSCLLTNGCECHSTRSR